MLMIIIGSGGDSKSEKNNLAPAAAEQKEAAITVTATQLLNDYESNEVAADAKYKGKLVEVSGTIENIGKDILDNPYVALETNSGSSIFVVQCMFDKSDQSQLATLTKNSRITLQGRVSGKLGNVVVRECAIVR